MIQSLHFQDRTLGPLLLGDKVLKAETTSMRYCSCSSWQKYGIYFPLYQRPTSSHPQREKAQDCEIQPFTELIWCSFQSLIALEYKRVKLKMLYVDCEDTLNPTLDVLLEKERQMARVKAEHKEMKLPMHHMLTLRVIAEQVLVSKQQGVQISKDFSVVSGCARTMCKKQPRRRLFHNHLCSWESLRLERSMAMATEENTVIGIWISSEGSSSYWLSPEITALRLSLVFSWKLTCKW